MLGACKHERIGSRGKRGLIFPNKCTLEKMTDLLALVAHIIGVFPRGILQGLLIELGRRGGEGLTFHPFLVGEDTFS